MFTIDYTTNTAGMPVIRVYVQGKLVQEYEAAFVNPVDIYELFIVAYNASMDPIGPTVNTIPY